MAPIETFMFMDFGTVYGDPENLTEVGLLAVPRSQYLEPDNDQEPSTKKVLDLCSNGFDMETFKEIDDFIKQQDKPVCLVSHGGHDFDFIILKRELQKLNVSLSDDLLCADSLYIFYDILKEVSKKVESTNVVVGPDEFEEQDPKTGEEEINYPSTSNVNHTIDVTSDQIADDKQVTGSQGNELKEDLLEENIQMQNEKTPAKRKLDANNKPIEDKRQKLHSNHLNLRGAKRKLDFDESYKYTGKPIRRIFFEGDNIKPDRSYTLGKIYDREVIHPPVNHHPAENDVYSKFRISHKLGRKFLAWTDQIQYKFDKVKVKKITFR